MAVPLEIKKISETVWELPATFRKDARAGAHLRHREITERYG